MVARPGPRGIMVSPCGGGFAASRAGFATRGDGRDNASMEPTLPQDPPAPRPIGPLAVLAESSGWLVVEKPAGLHSVALRRGGGESVEALLRRWRPALGELPEGGLVQRLDEGTSGCLLVATSAAERARLLGAIRDGSIPKRYLAGIDGPLADRGEFRLFFSSRHRRSAKATVRREGAPSEEGRCRWRTLPWHRGRSEEGRVLEVELLGPGRRHQIRAGLAHLGAPLRGDALYGGRTGTMPIPLHLHASSLAIDGRLVTSPPPPWAAAAIAAE